VLHADTLAAATWRDDAPRASRFSQPVQQARFMPGQSASADASRRHLFGAPV